MRTRASTAFKIIRHFRAHVDMRNLQNKKKNYHGRFQKFAKPFKINGFTEKNKFYKSHFSILQKEIRNVYDRFKSEAFYIRM